MGADDEAAGGAAGRALVEELSGDSDVDVASVVSVSVGSAEADV